MTPPYAHLPEHVVKALPKLTGKAARVLIAVASFMDRRGECRPGIETIGERAGIARRNTVSAAIQELQRAGVLAVERRRRKSSRFAWRILDKAESAASRKQDAAESAARYAAESAAQKDTTEEKKTSPASPEAAKRPAAVKEGSRKTPGPPVWKWWVDANRTAGQPDPLSVGPDLGAGRELGKLVASGSITEAALRHCMALYLADDDGFLLKKGHALRFLSGQLNGYRRNGPGPGGGDRSGIRFAV